MQDHDVFISYSSIDIEFADRIRELLQSKGISCWMAPYSIPYGGDYTSSIPFGIGNCRVFILLLSAHSMQSEWVPKELDSAISVKKRIIPFKIDDSILSMSFSFCLVNIQRIEAYTRFDDACEELVGVIRKTLAEQETCSKAVSSESGFRAPVLRSDYPYLQPRTTIGRDEILAQISSSLQSDRFLCLWGIGGIGKSKVAKQFLANTLQAKEYEIYVWLNYTGSMKDTILHLPFDYLDEEQFLAEKKRSCQGETCDAVSELAKLKMKLLMNCPAKTLLIIDGIDALTEEDTAFFRGVNCRVLFVTRVKSSLFPSIEVGELSKEDIRKVFFSFYEDGNIEAEEQVKSADRLITAVGRHTLTVKLLALYAQLTGMPLDEIYEELQAGSGELYDESIRDETGRDLSLDEQMYRLFSISDLSKIQQTILKRLSIFPFSGVKKYTFKKLCPESIMLDVDALVKKGWVKNEGGLLSIHPLVSHCLHRTFHDLSAECDPMIRCFIDTLSLNGTENILSQENNRIVLKTMLNYIDCGSLTGIRLFTAAGLFFNSLTYQHMIVKDTNQDPSFFSQQVNVGEESLEEYEEALKCLYAAEQAYKDRFPGADEVLLSDIYDGLGACYFNMNQFAMSRHYHLAAHELRKKLLPSGDKKRITSARRRAIACFYSGDVASAEREFDENLDELLRLYQRSRIPSEIVELAKGYSYVGKMKLHLNKAAEAELFFSKALETIKKTDTETAGRKELEDILKRNFGT